MCHVCDYCFIRLLVFASYYVRVILLTDCVSRRVCRLLSCFSLFLPLSLKNTHTHTQKHKRQTLSLANLHTIASSRVMGRSRATKAFPPQRASEMCECRLLPLRRWRWKWKCVCLRESVNYVFVTQVACLLYLFAPRTHDSHALN